MDSAELLSTKLFAGLKAKDISSLIQEADSAIHQFKRNDVLWHENEVVNGIGLLLKGALLSHRQLPGGKVQFVRFFFPHDIINLETGVSRKKNSPVSLTAEGPGCFIWFTEADLFGNSQISLQTASTIQSNLLACLADDAISYMKRMDILSRRTVRGRIIAYLSLLQEAQGNKIEIGMSQTDLAQFLCVDRSSLSAAMNNMQREGIIEFEKQALSFIVQVPSGVPIGVYE